MGLGGGTPTPPAPRGLEVVEDERRTDGVRLTPEDYQAIATQATALEHLGAVTAGRRNVVTPDDMSAVRAWVDGPRDRPLVIDAKVTKDRGAWWLEEAFGH